MNKIIVVLGMHRSGTSAITKGLELLGADLGEDLMPAVAGDNDKGFWEDLSINSINERLLTKLGSSWDALANVDTRQLLTSEFSEERHDAIQLLQRKTADLDIFAFKDPRTVNLLPFWQEIFSELELQDNYLIAIRNPRSVADSLTKRNNFHKQKSLYLWKKHTANALKYLSGRPAVVVDYDKLLAAPLLQIKRVAAAFSLAWPDQPTETMNKYAQEFLSSGLRHSLYEDNTANDIPEAVESLYQTLLAAASTNPEQSKFNGTDWSDTFTAKDFDVFLEYVDTLENDLGEAETLNSELEESFYRIKEHSQQVERESAEKTKKQTELYTKIHGFNRSYIGRVFKFVEKAYLFIRLKPHQETVYRSLVEESDKYLLEHQIDVDNMEPKRQGKIRLALQVLNYFIRHPYSSLRLVSWARIKKLFGTLLSSDSGAAENWISARFPTQQRGNKLPVLFPISESLDDQQLIFPVSEVVKVSIVIPVYNQYRTTLSCLQSVLAHTQEVDYEVILADDCSTDLTGSIEHRVQNITVVRGEENVGFLKNCNRAVSRASGDYIVLLNNDTNVQEGWLEPLLKVMESDPHAGIVGPKLIFENGLLQEAGGIIWNDASGWNFGRGQEPDLPEFNYLRETDYISGACIAFKKTVWDQLGGFDEAFCPAYYEDTDLAFQVRQNGLKVIYQPASVVVHFEGVSNGTDLSSGMKKHQLLNQKVFKQKWSETLQHDHFCNGENVFQARERSFNKRTVVFIDQYVPFFDKDAGSRSTYLYVKAMVESGIKVKFMPANFFPHQPYTSALQQLGVEVLFGEYYARNWKAWFKENAEHTDVVYLHRPHITEDFVDYLANLKPKPKLIYFGHDLHFLRTSREAELHDDASLMKQADDWKQREFAIFQKVDKVFYPSEIEVEEIKALSPATNVSALPLYLLEKPDVTQYNHLNRKDLLFVGGFGHPPNIDAMKWFVQEVMPDIVKQQADIKLNIVGSNVPDSIRQLASENVIVHGFLSDEALTELYTKVRIAVVPLRFGAGVKGKVLEALQAGLPIVTTPIGAEGIPEADKVMSISDNAESLASEILRLYENEAQSNRFISRYPDYIGKYFSRDAVQTVIDRNFLNQ